jgi:hypothetical protein
MFVVKYKNDRGDIKIFAKVDHIEDAYDAVDQLVEREITIEDVLSNQVIYEETW